MAVAKSRKTPSTRGMRRSHDALKGVQLSTDPTSGEVHLRHHVTKDGFAPTTCSGFSAFKAARKRAALFSCVRSVP